VSTYTTAKQAYTESSVMTATPEQLVVMLYDGAIRFLSQSAAAMRADNRDIALNRLRRGEAIIDELNVSLDMSQGEVAAQLRAIYMFCKRHLLEAHMQRDADGIDTVVRFLTDLRSSWQQIAARAGGAALEQPA
jgi:flagellar secretion chaperone FliS